MDITKRSIFFFIVIFLIIYLINAAPCRKAVGCPKHQKMKTARESPLRYSLKSGFRVKTTTMPPQIEYILAALQDKKFLKDKANFKALMSQLKEVYETSSSTICSRCRKN